MTITALALFGVALWLASGWARQAQPNDFTEYWAAGRLLLAGQNPYASRPMLELEKEAGFSGTATLAMRNPPWALPFMMPFSALPYAVAQEMWLLIGLAAVMLSVQLLWRLYACSDLPHWLGWLATATFVPVATVLAIGQIGPLVLLGIAGFLDSVEKRRDLRAGAFTLLVAIKPHLAFLFWLALVFWIVQQRRWRILLGFGVAVFIASSIPLAFDHIVFSQYLAYWKQSGIGAELSPTPSVLRFLFPAQGHWVEFIPAVVAAIWFLFHWHSTHTSWRWPQQLPLLLVVSVAAAPLSWFFDQVVLLPCVLQAAAWGFQRSRSRLWPVVSFLAINILTLIFMLGHRKTYWYAWTASAWLVWYLWVRVTYSQSREASPA